MAYNVDEYQRIGIEEIVPEATRILDETKSIQSVVIDRTLAVVNPQTPGTIQPSQDIDFRLQNVSHAMDRLSAFVDFDVVIAADASGCYHDDLTSSLFEWVSLTIGPEEVCRVNNFDKVSAVMTYAHANPLNYAQMWNQGSWKLAAGQGTNGVADSAVANYFRVDPSGVNARYDGLKTDAATVRLSIPLTSVFEIMRSNKYLPTQNIKNIEMKFHLNSSARFLYSQESTLAACSYTVTRAQLRYEAVTLSSKYLMMMDQVLKSGAGVQLPFSQVRSSYLSIPAGSGQNVQFTTPNKVLSNLTFGFYTTANDSSLTKFSSSGLVDPSISATDRGLRLNIGGQLYPNYAPLKTTEDVINHNRMAQHLVSHTGEQIGLYTKDNFTQTNGYGTFHMLFNFRKARHNEEDLTHDGLNLGAGGNVNLEGNFNSGLSCLMVTESPRVLNLRDGNITLE